MERRKIIGQGTTGRMEIEIDKRELCRPEREQGRVGDSRDKKVRKHVDAERANAINEVNRASGHCEPTLPRLYSPPSCCISFLPSSRLGAFHRQSLLTPIFITKRLLQYESSKRRAARRHGHAPRAILLHSGRGPPLWEPRVPRSIFGASCVDLVSAQTFVADFLQRRANAPAGHAAVRTARHEPHAWRA